jgi:hypothetical protein
MPMFDDVKILERPPEEKRARKKKGLHLKKKYKKCYPYAFSFKIKRNLRE